MAGTAKKCAMVIRKYECGPQISGTLYVVEDASKYDEAYEFIKKELKSKDFTLFTREKLKKKRESWRPYSQWWLSLWSIFTVFSDGTYDESYTEY